MGRMPVALIIAFVASLGLHAAALFGPDIDLAPEPEPPPLVAELRPLPPEPPVSPAVKAPRKVEPKPAKAPIPLRRQAPRKADTPQAPAVALPPSITVSEPATPFVPPGESPPETSPSANPVPAPKSNAPAVSRERLPARGSIHYRVDRGDSGFAIGVARQEWEFGGTNYRLTSTAETTGLAWLIRSVDIEMESLGRFTDQGLQPEVFGVMREGRKGRERALFDWDAMRILIGDRREHALEPGAQDFLSIFYQLGFVEIPVDAAVTVPLATGKKYAVFRVENLGDEEIDTPLGSLRVRHLRLPGDSSTELWLAYDYRLLPVKIRHIDNKGGVLVQVATEILFGQ